jgi:Rrf2 family nitric oxide-sensitive transcriptional repressor
MQLNRFTDLGLRVLMYLTQPARPTPFTISEMAQELVVSQNHLVKVVHFMSKQGWIKTTRGKGGGIVLAQAPTDYRLGKVVQILENNTSNQNSLVDCNHPPCILRPSCMLKSALDQAVQAFFDYLDQYTLADAIRQPVQHAISKENRIQILDLMAENLPIKAG